MNCVIATLTIVDNYPQECLFVEVDGSLRGEHVVAALTRRSGRMAGWHTTSSLMCNVDIGPLQSVGGLSLYRTGRCCLVVR